MRKRILSTLLVLCTVLPLLPIQVWAAGTTFGSTDPILPVETEAESEYLEDEQLDNKLSDEPYENVGVPSASDSTLYANSDWVTYPATGGDLYFDPTTGAIADCSTNVTSVDIPSSIDGVAVTSIDKQAFMNCHKLTSVTISKGVISIGPSAFYYCERLTNVTIPDSVVSIGEGAFGDCKSLTGIIIPNGVTSIESNTFMSCSGLTSVTIPNSVTSIGTYAFDGCSQLRSVTIPNRVISIGKYAFRNCSSLTDIIIPNSVSEVEIGVFNGCSGLKSVRISNSITRIDQHVFDKCSSLVSVTIPDSVTGIGYCAFDECTKLASVTIPTSVTSIDPFAFGDCSNLTDVYYSGQEEQWNAIQIRENNNELSSATIHFNSAGPEWNGTCGDNLTWSLKNGTLTISGTGEMQNYWTPSGSITGDGSTDVAPWQEYGNEIENIEIGEGVTSIGDRAFYGCNVINVTIPDSVVSIGYGAFELCTSLTDVYYGSSKADWDNISISNTDYRNEPLLNATIHYNSMDPNLPSDSNSYILDRVKSYTSDEVHTQYINIINSNDSEETKAQRLLELFLHSGLLDIREGVIYISYAPEDRLHYLYLTDNSVFSAFQYYNWLNHSVKGLMAKDLLKVDGLIFNNELSTWLNPFTYTGAKDLPGIEKYKDMLYDFMESQSLEIELNEYITFVKNIAEKTTSAGKLYANNLINDLNKCESIEDLSKALKSTNAQGIFQELKTGVDENGQLKVSFTLSDEFGFGRFAKNIGAAMDTISFVDMSVGYIIDIVELSGKLAVYEQYREFLHEVASSSDFPWELSMAAYSILQEMDSGIWSVLKNIATDIIEKTEGTGKLTNSVLKTVLGNAGAASLSEILIVINISSWCINKVVDIGAIVKGVAFVEGYAYLGMHFSKKLEMSKVTFLQNPSAENAWEFYNNYTLLYNLRYKGEEAVLNMHNFKGVLSIFTDFGYAEKKEQVEYILDYLEKCKFSIDESIQPPESVKYKAKSIVSCPVNVAVYAPDGTYITTLVDGVESDISNQYGRFAVVYRVYTGDYAKVICLKEDGNYTFKITGVDMGLLNFELAQKDDDNIYSFNNIEVAPGMVVQASMDQITDNQTYNIDYDGDEQYDESHDIQINKGNAYIAVTNIALGQSTLVLAKNETAILSVSVAPSDATRKNVYWVSTNPDIVDIHNGKVSANSVGTATVYCVSQDNPDVLSSCVVTVEDSYISGAYTVTFDANSGKVNPSVMSTNADGTLVSLPTPIRSNYVFNGWYTASNGGNKITTNTVFSSDTTVYAQWTYVGSGTPSTPTTPTNPGGWSPGSNNPPATSYYVSVPTVVGGKISINPTSASPGATVTITVTPDAGYELISLTVTGKDGKNIDLTSKGNSQYSFTMPNGKVTINVKFDLIWVNPFTDVTLGAWYYDAVKFANQNGLMNGVGNGLFAPSTQLSRAMLAEILYNKEGRPAVTDGSTFADAQPSAWYADAVAWASGNSIVNGYGNGLFGPDDDITREQVAVMLYRCAGSPVPPNLSLNFTDAYKVSDWAQDAVRWAVDLGILNGKGNGILDPTGKATRAEAAQMLKNYLDK